MDIQEAVDRVAAYLAARAERLAPPRVITSWHGIDLAARDLQALVDAARRPTRWTDPVSGAVYDLTRQYVDKDRDIWELSGWQQRIDGTLIPLFSVPACDDGCQNIQLPYVIADFGPLTVRPLPVEAGL